MKKYIVQITACVFAMSALLSSCSKDTLTRQQTVQSGTRLTRAPKVKVKAHAEYGTKREAKFNENHDATWGTNFSNGEPCQGKSFCVEVKIEVSLGIAKETVVSGGLMPAAGQLLTDNSSFLHVCRDATGNFYIEINSDEILPATAQRIFANGVYVQDQSYAMPAFITQAFGVQSLILPAGSHPVTIDNGKIIFYF
ncbi:MAG: hypothetical protein RL660_786 [Bacteroidota bacterium]|jgi:hypothetical protein